MTPPPPIHGDLRALWRDRGATPAHRHIQRGTSRSPTRTTAICLGQGDLVFGAGEGVARVDVSTTARRLLRVLYLYDDAIAARTAAERGEEALESDFCSRTLRARPVRVGGRKI